MNEKYTKEQEELARLAKAISHPIRITILELLASEECCYHGDMSEILPVAKSTLSQHLKELKDAGLIRGEITPPLVKYCINADCIENLKKLMGVFFDKMSQPENCC